MIEDVLPRAAEIVADVRRRGDAAVMEWAERVDGGRPAALRVAAGEIAAAEVDDDAMTALRRLAGAVAGFHRPQRPPDVRVEAAPGIISERRFVPLASVGVYVPGGRASLASSLVMAAVPARLAGVDRIAVASPSPSAAVLVAASDLGIDEVYAVGGAHAIAALAYGTETVGAVDKIVGPGGQWVTAAKLLVSARVAIDLPAGPSEIVVVGDETADPALCAADLLAQAEHGPDTLAVLLTTSAALAEAVEDLTGERVRIEVVDTVDEALARVDELAPEHLELHVADPESVAGRIRNAGAVFLGPFTPAVLGDYAAGANHVLPTGRLARGAGGLGLEAFLKPVQVVRASEAGLKAARPTVTALARIEGLPRHAAAVEARFAVA